MSEQRNIEIKALKEVLTQNENNEDGLSKEVNELISQVRDKVDFLTLIYNNLKSLFSHENEFEYALNLIRTFKNNENTSKKVFLEFVKDLALANGIFEVGIVFKKYGIDLKLN